jgi:hypothetical protein
MYGTVLVIVLIVYFNFCVDTVLIKFSLLVPTSSPILSNMVVVKMYISDK